MVVHKLKEILNKFRIVAFVGSPIVSTFFFYLIRKLSFYKYK